MVTMLAGLITLRIRVATDFAINCLDALDKSVGVVTREMIWRLRVVRTSV